MAYRLTSDLVQGVGKYLCKKYDAKIADKSDAVSMQMVAFTLEVMGIQRADRFMENYATTVGTIIYLPFRLGSTAAGDPPLNKQVEVLFHEFHHVRQYQKEGRKFFARYLTSSSKRTWYEARALHVSMESQWFLAGRLENTDKMADKLRAYGCTKGDIRTVAKHLKIASSAVRRGKIHNRVTKDGTAWLMRQKPNRRSRK